MNIKHKDIHCACMYMSEYNR